MKVSKTKHITKKGVVKKNPTRKIYVALWTMKDWKESWSSKEIMSAVKEANRIYGKIAIIKETNRSDADAIYVYRGMSENTLQSLDEDYGIALGDKIWTATSVPELKRGLQEHMEINGWS